jgi:hypothetical protein
LRSDSKRLKIAAGCRSHPFCIRLGQKGGAGIILTVGVASSHELFAPLLDRIDALPSSKIWRF